MEEKVSATPAALKLIEQIVAEHGPILFHQSGGCCDGSSPMCYPQKEFIVGDNDVLLGHIGGAPVYISASQFEAWKHTDLIIEVVPGRGGMSFENGHEADICQRSIEIEAPSRGRAAELAKMKFCETENVRDWSLHADRVQIADAEFPS